MTLNKDLNEFIGLLVSHRVDFLIVGAHAMAFHGRPRFTGDVDIWIDCSEPSADLLMGVIEHFGFGATGLSKKDFMEPDQVIQLGVAPHRIDILTGLSGLVFDEAWRNRVEGNLGDHKVYFLSKKDLIQNKRACGRDQDWVDIKLLEQD